MSDDLSMRALGGTMRERAAAALRVGCDLLLHCNGQMAEMRDVASEAPRLTGDAKRRTSAALARQNNPQPLDLAEARRAFSTMMARVRGPGDSVLIA